MFIGEKKLQIVIDMIIDNVPFAAAEKWQCWFL
jgi:hypothetical protein